MFCKNTEEEVIQYLTTKHVASEFLQRPAKDCGDAGAGRSSTHPQKGNCSVTIRMSSSYLGDVGIVFLVLAQRTVTDKLQVVSCISPCMFLYAEMYTVSDYFCASWST
jgi:hypothetical protein